MTPQADPPENKPAAPRPIRNGALVVGGASVPIALVGLAGTALFGVLDAPKPVPAARLWVQRASVESIRSTKGKAKPAARSTAIVEGGDESRIWLRDLDQPISLAAFSVASSDATWTVRLPLAKPELLADRPLLVRLGYRLSRREGWANARIEVMTFDNCAPDNEVPDRKQLALCTARKGSLSPKLFDQCLRNGASGCEVWTETVGAIERKGEFQIRIPAENVLAARRLNLHIRLSVDRRPAGSKTAGAEIAIDWVMIRAEKIGGAAAGAKAS